MSLPLTGAGSPGGWTPARLPGIQPSLALAASLAKGGVWVDAGKTTRASTNGATVAVITCPFTGVDLTTGGTVVLNTDGLKHWWLTYDGASSSVLNLGAGQPTTALSAFSAVQFTDVAANRTLLGSSAASGDPWWHVEGSTDKKQYLYNDGVVALPGGNAALAATTWYLLGVTYNSPTVAYRKDRAADGGGSQATTFTTTPNRMGILRSGNLMSGKMAALIWGTSAWSVADVALLEAYIRRLYP